MAERYWTTIFSFTLGLLSATVLHNFELGSLYVNDCKECTTSTPTLQGILPQQYSFSIVTDLDKKSRDRNKFEWHAHLKKGTLQRNPRGNYTIFWNDEDILMTSTATKNRSMELSELVYFQDTLFAMCDFTGIVYEIDNGKAFQRFTLANGNGREPNSFKSEWATVKDGLMYIGSIGKEWVVSGETKHHDAEWVKTIDKHGRVEHLDWSKQYQALRVATNTTFPGYLSHEAVVWHEGIQKWIFLPRKVSENVPYAEETDEMLAGNMLITADDTFSHIDVRKIGPLLPELGFTSMKIIPDTGEILALRVREIGEETETWITVFNLEGNFLLEPEWMQFVSDDKFEGLEFVPVND